MNKEYHELLSSIAETFNTTAEHLWEVTVNQAVINGIHQSIFMIMWMIMSYHLLTFLKEKMKSKLEEGGMFSIGEQLVFLRIMFTLLLIITCALVPNCITGIITAFFNPEYWALQNIMSLIKNDS